MKSSRHKPARIEKWRGGILARYILASSLAWPALAINPNWGGNSAIGWKLTAVCGIIAVAVFIEVGRHAGVLYGLLFLAAGAYGMHVNSLLALKNASHASEDDKHARKTHNLAVSEASSQSSQSSRKRQALVELAGETPSETYEAQIQARIAKDIRLWNASDECKDFHSKVAGAFCAEVATLTGKLKAAKARETHDAAGGVKTKVGVEKSEDPFAETFPKFAAAFGFTVSKENATDYLNGVLSMWLEIMAGLGPAGILILFGVADGVRNRLPALEPRAPPAPNIPVTLPGSPPVPAAPAVPVLSPVERKRQAKAEADDKIQRLHDLFVADHLEDCNGVFMLTGEPFGMWTKFCAARGEQPGSQKLFSQRLAVNFRHDHNGGRPRFLNVRAKRRQPKLSVVGSE